MVQTWTHMIQLREIQTSGVEHGRKQDDGEANDEGDDGASMVHGRTVNCRGGLCR